MNVFKVTLSQSVTVAGALNKSYRSRVSDAVPQNRSWLLQWCGLSYSGQRQGRPQGHEWRKHVLALGIWCWRWAENTTIPLSWQGWFVLPVNDITREPPVLPAGLTCQFTESALTPRPPRSKMYSHCADRTTAGWVPSSGGHYRSVKVLLLRRSRSQRTTRRSTRHTSYILAATTTSTSGPAETTVARLRDV